MSLPSGYDAWKTASPYDDEGPCEVCGLDTVICICPECPKCSVHGDPRCEINRYKLGDPVRNLADLGEVVGCAVERIGRALYKSTDCGIVFNEKEGGVTVCGYAEGADAECVPIELQYPFPMGAFWNAVEQADNEGSELWDEWNLEEEESE